jgi:aspartate carbamoyltransferase catalytic subunit
MISFPSVLDSINDLNLNQINSILQKASHFQKNPNEIEYQLNNRPIIATSFLENSTRTKHSFAIAIQKLGAMYLDFNAEMSSLKKGESLEETLLTLYNQGVNLCIVRTSVSHQFEEFKKAPPIKIINGGDGINEHPSQALLDLYTLIELANGATNLKNKSVSIIGDLVHSRVGHSLIKLLPLFGIKVILCGPNEYLPSTVDFDKNIFITNNRDEAICNSDFIYMLRIQKERHEKVNPNLYERYFETHGINLKLLKKLNKLIPVLHPGPCNVGVEIDHEIMKSSLYKGHLQVFNSVPVRMAIIQSILNNNDKNIGIIHGEKF